MIRVHHPIAALVCSAALAMPALSWAQGYGDIPRLTPQVLAGIAHSACVETRGNLMKMTAMANAARLPETARADGALISWKLPGLLTISAMSDGACRLTIDDRPVEWLDSSLIWSNTNVLIDEEKDGDTHLKRYAFRSASLPVDNIRVMEVILTSDELADTLTVTVPSDARQSEYRSKGIFDAARKRLDLKAGFQIDDVQAAFTRYCLATGGNPDLMRERITADGGTEKPRQPDVPEVEWRLADRAVIGISGNKCALVTLNEQPALKSHSFGPDVQSLAVNVMGPADMPQRIVYATLTATPDKPEGRLTPVMVTNSSKGMQFLAMPDSGPILLEGWSEDGLRQKLRDLNGEKSPRQ